MSATPTTTATEPPAEAADDPLDALQAWALLLPAALLAWPGPGALLRDVPTTVSAGTGWTALACLPLAILMAWRLPTRRLTGITLLLAVIAVAALGAGAAGDTFGARRSTTALITALVLALGGAGLGPAGRRVLSRGFAICAALWLVRAGLDRGRAFSGVLGNTGDLSEAALPGALLALGLVATTRGKLRAAALATGVAYAVYVGAVPVLAGAVSLVVVGAAILVAASKNHAARPMLRGLLIACLIAVVTLGAREWLARPGASGVASGTATTEQESNSFGGWQFRKLTWARLPDMLRDNMILGVGPGQFEAEFPAYRDPLEIELSSHRRQEPTPVEVEHAHNDWFQGPVELGLLGGGPWVVFLLLAAFASLRALWSSDGITVGLGAAALGVLVNAGFNAPLLAGPAAPAVAWPILGCVLSTPLPSGERSRHALRMVTWLAGGLLILRAPAAWKFVRHGAELAGFATARVVAVGESARFAARDVAQLLDRALVACPDSVVALEKRYELLRATGASAEERIRTLRNILDLRPDRFATLLNLGAVLATERSYDQARAFFSRAAELDPASPRLAKNRLTLALEMGDLDRLLESIRQLSGERTIDDAWLERTAAGQLLSGRPGTAQALLQLLDGEMMVTDGNRSYTLADQLREEGGRDLLADGALANAHFLWAREHVAGGVPETAIRSYRQALQIADRHAGLPDAAVGVRMELAAAEVLAERYEAARATMQDLDPTAIHWRKLPTWAGQALLDAGLMR